MSKVWDTVVRFIHGGPGYVPPPRMGEDWDQYEIRRGSIILGRSGTEVRQPPSESDAHQKAGCFDCDLLWNGETAAAEAIEHQRAAGHEIWRIYRPD